MIISALQTESMIYSTGDTGEGLWFVISHFPFTSHAFDTPICKLQKPFYVFIFMVPPYKWMVISSEKNTVYSLELISREEKWLRIFWYATHKCAHST